MRIGIDFDNTIVCYDGLFHRLAVARGLVERDVQPCKSAVRDRMRAGGREAEWTALQGEAYGPAILAAEPYPGVVDFLRRAAEHGLETHIVSHKTRRPYAGPAHDLHEAALRWLTHAGLVDVVDAAIPKDNVHLLPTRQAKLQRIGELRCDGFIDDLPDILLDDSFPAGVQRILFDPHDRHTHVAVPHRLRSWADAFDLLQSAGATR